MVSAWKAGLKITQYEPGSNPLDTVVRAKVLKPSPDDRLRRPRAQLPASRTTCWFRRIVTYLDNSQPAKRAPHGASAWHWQVKVPRWRPESRQRTAKTAENSLDFLPSPY